MTWFSSTIDLRAAASFRTVLAATLTLLLRAVGNSADFALPCHWQGSLHGFGQVHYSGRPGFDPSPAPEGLGAHGFLLAEERLQLKLEARSPKGKVSLLARPEFYHDAVAEKLDTDLREGYLDYTRESWGLRLGRQIVTWGVGDLVFINDVFPKDYAAFFSGRPLEYLKQGVDAAALEFHSEILSADLVVIPPGLFTADHLPPRGRFVEFDPLPTVPRQRREPLTRLTNTETALRLYRTWADTELSVYAHHGFWRRASLRPDDVAAPAHVQESFPGLVTFGASARRGGLGGVWGAEVGYYDSLDDRGGSNPAVENSQIRFLLTYQRQLGRDFTGNLEYYTEWMQHDAAHLRGVQPGAPVHDELRDLIGLRLTKLLRYQTLKLSLFTLSSPSQGDFLINPEVTYHFGDRLWAALGGNVFGGPAGSFFGQLNRNDNVYVAVRCSF
jgi:hypothetical protein